MESAQNEVHRWNHRESISPQWSSLYRERLTMDWPKKKSRWYSISILLKFPWKASMMELLNLKCTQSSFRQWNKISHSFKTVANDLVGIRRHRCEWWPQSMHQVRRQVFYIFHWPPLAFWRFRVLQRVSAGFEGWQSQSDSCCDSTTVFSGTRPASDVLHLWFEQICFPYLHFSVSTQCVPCWIR